MLQPKLLTVEPLDAYKLLLQYETNEKKLFDVSAYISGNWYGKLKDKGYFKSVHICSGGTGIEWPDGQDIAPHELYDKGIPVKSL
jgi:hypothetical protein